MKQAVIILIVCTFYFSCKKEEKNITDEREIATENQQSFYDQLDYKFNLPDTVTVNKLYSATIEFESDFDKIIPPIQVSSALNDTTKTRVITFYRFESFKHTMKPTELVIIDTAFVLNKSFDINNIVFKEKGEFVFCGLIEDRIMYNHYNEKGIRDSVHFDRLKQEIFKNVVVIDK